MSDYEILKTSDDGKFRVKLVPDEHAGMPEDDGAWPVLRIDIRNPEVNPEHVGGSSRPRDRDDYVEAAIRCWSTKPRDSNWKLFEKYLRAFHGVTQIRTWRSDDWWYVAYDSAQWREWVGVGLEQLADEDPLSEMRAWAEGDVYGYVIEKRVTWRPANPSWEPGDPEYPDMQTWEEIPDGGSCYGFYGYTYAEEAALEEFAAFLGSRGESETESSSEPVYVRDNTQFRTAAEAVVDLFEAHLGFDEIDVTARDGNDTVEVVQFHDIQTGKYVRITIEEVEEEESE